MPTMHPGMNVALYGYGNFLCFPGLNDGRRSGWLRAVPRNISGHGIRLRMDVVRGLIASRHFKFLTSVHCHDMRGVHATLLVKYWGCGLLLCGIGRAQTLRDI